MNISIVLNGADEMASGLTWLRSNGFEYLIREGAPSVPTIRDKGGKEGETDSPILQAFYQAFPGARLRVNEGETRESAAKRRFMESPEKAALIGFNLETMEWSAMNQNEEISQIADENDAY